MKFRIACAVAVVLTVSSPASAFSSANPALSSQQAQQDRIVFEARRAVEEERYLDAGRIIDQALVSGVVDPRLTLLVGELHLVRGRPAEALTAFAKAQSDPSSRASALQGEGIALSMLRRSPEAIATLRLAVEADPMAFRAWNALAVELDQRGDWAAAEQAYEKAITNANEDAAIYNNRGFSRLLQRRLDEAVADFVAALERKPDLATARTNLRLAMAMRGEYDQAIAGGQPAEQAALLNNAGFAAVVRGDLEQGVALLDRAARARGEYYARASANLEIARSLSNENKSVDNADQ